MTGSNGKYKYTLVVEQQPQRARMCGFGDKDRRPITPPPCIRLIVRDANNDEEIKIDEIDGAFFVLQVDLWDPEAKGEVNIVRASSQSPAVSISTATMTSYPPVPERHVMAGYGPHMGYNPAGSMYYGPAQPPGPPGNYPPGNNYAPTIAYAPTQSGGNNGPMFTRNLIGSLTVNGTRLKDTNKKENYWFVLQDLSIRTEGWFRLKMSFIDLNNANGPPGLNKAKCPVLASVFSEKFQVFSAKKFPGVIESTDLSKIFAGQGIKLPIRKEGAHSKNEDVDD